MKAAHRLGAQMRRDEKQLLNADGLEEVLNIYPPAKRERYQEGLDTPLNIRKHAAVTAFVKQENVPFKTKDKPRLVQFRTPTFLAHMLAWYKPFEHAYVRGRYLYNKYQKFTCAKSMDPIERMDTIKQCVADLENCHVVGLDGSAFDAHQGPNSLEAEWRFTVAALKEAGFSPEIVSKATKMGEAQKRNRVKAFVDDGFVKYTVNGNRMSGDLNTGTGNTVLQSSYIASFCKDLGIPEAHWRMLVDGDDALLFVSGKYIHLVTAESVDDGFRKYSQEIDLDRIEPVTLDTLETIEFCQSRPVCVDGIWRLIRNPRKVYNGYCATNIWYREMRTAKRFWATVSRPELIYSVDVPVLDAMFKCLNRLSEDSRPLETVSRRYWLRNCERCQGRMPTGRGVSIDTRVSFERAFGMSLTDQLACEEEFDAWELHHLPQSPDWQYSEASTVFT